MLKVKVVCIICLCIVLLGNTVSADEAQDVVRAKIGIKLLSGDEIRRAKAREQVTIWERLWVYVVPEPNPAYIYVVYNNQNTVTRLNDDHQTKISGNLLLKLPPADDDELFYSFDAESSLEYITIICSPVELPEIDQLLNTPDMSYTRWLEFEKELIEKSKIDLRDIAERPLKVGSGVRGLPGFKFTEQALDNLRHEGVPDTILNALKPLENQEPANQSEFLEAVEKQIGKDQTVSYKELILKHARFWETSFSEGIQSSTDDSFIEQLKIFSGNTLVVKKYEFHVKKQ